MIKKLLYITISMCACKSPSKDTPTPVEKDSVEISFKVAKNADLSKIDLSKVVISSQPINLYSKDIDALKKQNAAQDSIMSIVRSDLATVLSLRRKDSLQIVTVRKQADSVRHFIDTTALYPNTSQFDFTNHILSIKGKAGPDTLVRQ